MVPSRYVEAEVATTLHRVSKPWPSSHSDPEHSPLSKVGFYQCPHPWSLPTMMPAAAFTARGDNQMLSVS